MSTTWANLNFKSLLDSSFFPFIGVDKLCNMLYKLLKTTLD